MDREIPLGWRGHFGLREFSRLRSPDQGRLHPKPIAPDDLRRPDQSHPGTREPAGVHGALSDWRLARQIGLSSPGGVPRSEAPWFRFAKAKRLTDSHGERGMLGLFDGSARLRHSGSMDASPTRG